MAERERRQRRVRNAAPVPNLHFVMIIVSGVLTIFFCMLYQFADPQKSRFYELLIPMPLAFLFGKLSNQFGKPMVPSPPVISAVERDLNGNGIPDDEEEENDPNA